MKVVFADTSFYQALLNPKDKWHTATLSLSRELHAPVVTSEYVLCELGALMSHGALRSVFLEVVRSIEATPQVEIVHASREWFQAGLHLFAERADKKWSLTDCISFALMKKRGIDEALTTDHHFEQAGFHCLPER